MIELFKKRVIPVHAYEMVAYMLICLYAISFTVFEGDLQIY